jgi:hypothetical protein
MSQPVYRPLFLNAWKIAWQHKRLWLFGIPAFFMAAGGLFETVSNSWQQANSGRIMAEQLINGTIPGYQWLISYSRYLSQLNPLHQYLITLFFLFLLGLGLFIGATSQGAILNGTLEKRPIKFLDLFKKGKRFFIRLLTLDVLGKIAAAALFGLTVLPVAFFNPLPCGWYKFPPLISFIIFLSGTIFINIIQILSLVAVTRKHLSIKAAVTEAWHIFRLHKMVSLEFGGLLFLSSLMGMLILLISLFIISLPITAIFIITVATASPTIYILSIIFSVLLILADVFLIIGWLTAFQYTAWSLFFEEMERFGIVSWIKRRLKK